MNTTPIPVICIEPDHRGRWEVMLPGQPGHLTCPTLEDARTVARLRVADRSRCDLVVRDAYHRVVVREALDA